MNYLENLTRQYYEWKGYIVKTNVKVGRLAHGGWSGELDVIAYHPQKNHLLHIEPSTDAHSWNKREDRFEKKFNSGRKHIHKDIFPWLDKETKLEQIAILKTSTRKELCGRKIISIDEFVSKICKEISEIGAMSKNAIPEELDLLRTIQLTTNGYFKIV